MDNTFEGVKIEAFLGPTQGGGGSWGKFTYFIVQVAPPAPLLKLPAKPNRDYRLGKTLPVDAPTHKQLPRLSG